MNRLDKLKIALIAQGLTVTEFASKIGVNPSMIYMAANEPKRSKRISDEIDQIIALSKESLMALYS